MKKMLALIVVAAGMVAGVWYASSYYHSYQIKQADLKALKQIAVTYHFTPEQELAMNKQYTLGESVGEIKNDVEGFVAHQKEQAEERKARMEDEISRGKEENDKLELSNLELEKETAELEGKPFNMGKKMNDLRARIAADKLADELIESSRRMANAMR